MGESGKKPLSNYVNLSILKNRPSVSNNTVNKKNAKSGRYPRSHVILIFDSIKKLELVNFMIAEMGRILGSTAKNISEKDWDLIVSWLDRVTEPLKKAYVEYEQYWQPPDWDGYEDEDYINGFDDLTEMGWRVADISASYGSRVFRGGRQEVHEPIKDVTLAEVACAQALYAACFIRNERVYHPMVEEKIAELQTHLSAYHMGALQLVVEGHAVFAPGRAKGAVSALRKLIEEMIKLHGILDIESLWKLLKAETSNKTVMTPIILQEVDDEDGKLFYRAGRKESIATKRSIQDLLSNIYKENGYPPYEYLKELFLRDTSVGFPAFWSAIKAECVKRTVTNFESTKIISADDEMLVYRTSNRRYSTPKSVVWNKFRALKRKNN